MNTAEVKQFSREDELVDGSTVATYFDASSQLFRTVHTCRGVSSLQHTWRTAEEAQQGHSRTLREITATITSLGGKE